MNSNSRGVPLLSDSLRLRRNIDIINQDSDYDSEYANHPPPTDSEIEIEIDPAFIHSRMTADNIRRNERTTNRINNSGNVNGNNNISTISGSHDNSSSSLMTEMDGNHHHHHYNPNNIQASRNLLFGTTSTAMEDLYKQRNRLKDYGLKRLTIKQHILVTICRDIPIYSFLKNFIVLISQWYKLIKVPYNNITTVRATEFFLASIWCLVSALLSYTILDGLMIRWMVIYDVHAVIVRILSMSLIIIMVIEMFNYTFNNADNEFCLTVWIFISCVLTLFFILQCFLSSNLIVEKQFTLDENRSKNKNNNIGCEINNDFELPKRNEQHTQKTHFRSNSGIADGNSNDNRSGINHNNNENNFKGKYKRKVDFYNLVVYAVVPVGVASFVSMVGLVRLLVILRLDIGIEILKIQQGG